MGPKFDPSKYGKPRPFRKAGSFVQVEPASIDQTKSNVLSWQNHAQTAQSDRQGHDTLGDVTNCISVEPAGELDQAPVLAQDREQAVAGEQLDATDEHRAKPAFDLGADLPVPNQASLPASLQTESLRDVQPPSYDPTAHLTSKPSISSETRLSGRNPDAPTNSSISRPATISETGDYCSKTVQSESQSCSKAMIPRGDPSPKVDRSDRLKLLQDDSLRKITRKVAARRGNEKNTSVSMRDLDLARTPVDVNDPGASSRRWASDSTLYESGEAAAVIAPQVKELSMIPQVSATETSQIKTANLSNPKAALQERRSRWAVKDEMKPEKVEAGSNDWGSVMLSDATHSTNSSDKSFGKLLQRRGAEGRDESIMDWEGKMMPPPADWEERRRYNNNNPEFKDRFRNYVRDVKSRFANGIPISTVSVEKLKKYHLHPDGIGMRRRTETIGIHNAEKYGYTTDVHDVVKYAQSITEHDYEKDSKLNSEDEGNATFDRDETTHKLVTNWNMHIANARGERLNIRAKPQQDEKIINGTDKPTEIEPRSLREDISVGDEDDEAEDGAPLTKPMLNIYLRPATIADLSELTRIYNWYVENGSQPAELLPAPEDSMKFRLDACDQSKLPFLVAATMSQKGAKSIPLSDLGQHAKQHGLPVKHKAPSNLTRIEKLAGFCCASDFTQPDYIEHISIDIELYVDSQYQRMGVGKCLMDKMLEICDRSYRLTMDVPFHCANEIRHKYGPGGVRELHKIVVQLRKWHTPKLAKVDVKGPRKSRKLAFVKTHEDEYNRWLREWLETLGFEVEGVLKKMGAKNGRYIDLVYFTRETCWQPQEGHVPGPLPEFVDEGEDEEE